MEGLPRKFALPTVVNFKKKNKEKTLSSQFHKAEKSHVDLKQKAFKFPFPLPVVH